MKIFTPFGEFILPLCDSQLFRKRSKNEFDYFDKKVAEQKRIFIQGFNFLLCSSHTIQHRNHTLTTQLQQSFTFLSNYQSMFANIVLHQISTIETATILIPKPLRTNTVHESICIFLVTMV
jgi:hypothetical protein